MSPRFRAVILWSIVVSAACSRGAPAAPNAGLRAGSLIRSNVLLVTIDTLRWDRVGAYAGGGLTPGLDRVAAAGVRFTQAHAHVPMTQPAHTSILTGLLPRTHGIRTNGATALGASHPTLATLLHDSGYRTGAFVGAFVLDARFGLSRGFDTYDDRVGADTGPITFAFAERTADRVTQLAGDWIVDGGRGLGGGGVRAGSERGQSGVRAGSEQDRGSGGGDRKTPWLCWVHLFDPHAPYRAPEQRVANPYDNEVAYADAQLGRLFDRLRGAGQLDSTLVVVLADHGESLGEHGEATHGLFAYESTLRIPLILSGPSIHPAVVDAPVGQTDLLPTILDLLGVAPPPHLDGRSLVPALRGESWPGRPIHFEALDAALTRNWAPLTGVIADGWKYIDLPDAELYDLAHDPGEQRNLLQQDAARGATMRRLLSDAAASAHAAEDARPAPIDPDAAGRLRALGYTGGSSVSAVSTRHTAADDPKHLTDLDRKYEEALTLTGSREYQKAAALLSSVIAERPDFVAAYLNLASVFIAGGAPQRAAALLESALSHGVDTPDVKARLGAAYLAMGDARRAVAALEPVADPARPGGLEAANTLGVALTELDQRDRARRLFTDVLAQSPRSATTWNNLGLLELADRKPQAAAQAFEQATAADPKFVQAWQGLGAARAESDPAGAITAWTRALELEPRDYDVMFNLAVTLRQQGRAAAARPLVERFVREAPPDRYGRDIATFRRWLEEPP